MKTSDALRRYLDYRIQRCGVENTASVREVFLADLITDIESCNQSAALLLFRQIRNGVGDRNQLECAFHEYERNA